MTWTDTPTCIDGIYQDSRRCLAPPPPIQIEVIDEENPGKVKVLTEGNSFGLKSLLYNIPMESSARAITHVDMFSLGETDFELIVREHPITGEMISEIAQNTYGIPIDLGYTSY